MKRRVGIIGGGLGGLAAACTLAARGFEVSLFEKNSWIGGKAAVLQQDGYRFDMGPTIVTLPSVIRRIFREAERNVEDYLDLRRLDPQWRCFFTDHTTLDLVADTQTMSQKIAEFSPQTNSAEGYRRFIALSERLHSISDRFFFWRSIGGMADMFDPRSSFQLRIFADVFRMRMGHSVASTVRAFVPDERVAQMIDHFTQYVGSAPDLSPAVLCSIAHMQTSEGVWYPIGGTRAVPEALIKLGTELGVEFRPNTEVTRIRLTDRGAVRGIELADGETLDFDFVVSNEDTVRTHRELLAGTKAATRFERRRNYEAACSGVVLYLGLDRRYEQLLHHNFVFSKDPHVEFEQIYREGRPAEDPTCYVCAPAISEPEVAPPGGEALYILVHTPYLRPDHDWSKMLPAYRQVILRKMADTAGLDDLESRIKTEAFLTPQDIHERYRVLNGAIYGLASHGKWKGAFKPANRSPDVPGLYMAGGSAHPGPGMPMALMSGWIAGDTLAKDQGVRASKRHPVGV